MKSKLKNYLTEDKDSRIYLDSLTCPAIGYSEKWTPCCLNCFYSLAADVKLGPKFIGMMTCENPDVFEMVVQQTIKDGFSDFKGDEKYHGQIDMMVKPQGKCKFWKKGRI